jgi:hypothetical protein
MQGGGEGGIRGEKGVEGIIHSTRGEAWRIGE